MAVAVTAQPRRRFLRALGGLTAAQIVANAFTLLTGPLQARLLGPQGRGELALILVVTGFATLIAGLGLNTFLAQQIASTRERGVLLGTVTALSVALGTVGALFAYPVSAIFGDGEVQAMIFVGLLLLPLTVVGANLWGGYWGDENWRWFSIMRVLPPLLIAVFYVALALVDEFDVTTAALAGFAAALLSMLPLVPLLHSTRGWGFDRRLARRALTFGGKYNLTAIAGQGNLRVDQLLVAGIASARELGFYVVAASLASATWIVGQALNLLVVPMVAKGDDGAVRRILRITLAGMTAAATVLALAAQQIVELLFGPEFDHSVGMARILCFGAVFVVGKGIVTSALVGHGRPGETAIVEIATLALMTPALLVVVPPFGATGAAVVVAVASAGGLVALAARTRRWLGGRLREYLVPTPADARWLIASLRP